MILISGSALWRMQKLSLSTIYLSLEKGLCAKYKYSLSFEAGQEKYTEYYFRDIKIMVSTEHENILKDVTIDYLSSLMRKKFYISDNPAASRECGCGMTFTN